jgi:Uma2 family endonuclease
MEETLTATQFLIAIKDGDKILRDRPFVIIDEQILFYHKESKEVVFTQITDEQDYTADDYLQLPENAPYQLINGKLIYMAAPEDRHQEIAINLSTELQIFVKSHKLGKVRFSPYDVHFDKENIFQPDILFVSIARASIIQKKIDGAPDFIVEISSPGTEKINRNRKMKIYGKYDVIEYWIVSTEKEQIEVYHNKNHKMQLVQTASRSDKIISKAIKGFELEVEKVFSEE